MVLRVKLPRLLAFLLSVIVLLSLAACASRTDTPAPHGGQDDETPAESGGDDAALTCTLVIRCDTLLDNLEGLAEGKAELVPSDGLLLEASDVSFAEGESVFDVLKREMQSRRMHLEFSESPLYGSAYVEGICNLYDYDCGELSGWVYRVNGERPGYGCSQYILSDGDVVEWLYTCDLGDDL